MNLGNNEGAWRVLGSIKVWSGAMVAEKPSGLELIWVSSVVELDSTVYTVKPLFFNFLIGLDLLATFLVDILISASKYFNEREFNVD